MGQTSGLPWNLGSSDKLFNVLVKWGPAHPHLSVISRTKGDTGIKYLALCCKRPNTNNDPEEKQVSEKSGYAPLLLDLGFKNKVEDAGGQSWGFFFFKYLFTWLHQVSAVVHKLFLALQGRRLHCRTGSVAAQPVGFPDQGSNLCPLDWKADS